MIKATLRAFLINGVALYLTAYYISGFNLPKELKILALVVLVFTLVHLLVKPILKLFMGPINFITFGLVSLALDVGILYGLTILFRQLSFTPWQSPEAMFLGIIIPAYNLNSIAVIIVSAISVNFVRTALSYLAS